MAGKSLLSTKLSVPRPRPGLVPRPRLIERLDAGLSGKLTLVSAPAGFGKTTLLSEWVRSKEYGVGSGEYAGRPLTGRNKAPTPYSLLPTPFFAWLSLDEADNDVSRFLSYLLAALRTVHEGLGEVALAVLQSPQQPSVQAILTSTINELTTLTRPTVLILDDYHVIDARPVDEAVAFLLEHLPPPAAGLLGGLHLVIASRADPFLPLSRLRARGQMLELRADELRFSPAEATAYLNQVMELGLSEADVAALENRTEGWVTGLHLAALSVQDRVRSGQDPADFISAFAGEDRYIVDYLVDEVLARQPQGTREFLIQTCILDRMTGSLCDAVCFGGTETPSSSVRTARGQDLLERLDQANLFVVPLDHERRWYRYHHLFADLLRHRLRATDPQTIPELYRRASAWYEVEGEIEEAIRYALGAQDDERAARLLDQIAFSTIAGSEFRKLFRWIDALPETARQAYPRLCLSHAWALQFVHRLDAVEPILARVEGPQAGATYPQQLISANASAIRSYVARKRGDYARAIELAQQVLETLSDDASEDAESLRGAAAVNLGIVHSRLGQIAAAEQALTQAIEMNRRAGSPFAALSSVTHLVRLHICQGQLHRAGALGRQGLDWIAEWHALGTTRSRVSAREVHVEMGRLLYEWNDLSGAAEHLKRAREYEELSGTEFPVASQVALVHLRQALGDLDAALAHLEEVAHLLTPAYRPRITPQHQAQIALAQMLILRLRPDQPHLLASAIQWAQDVGLDPAGDLAPAREGHYAALAVILLAQDRPGEALSLLGRLCQAAASTGCSGDRIRYLIWRSLAHRALAQRDLALSSLKQALVLAQPQGYVRSFVDQGEPIAECLTELRTDDAKIGAYIRRLLSAFGKADPHPPGVRPQPLVEALTRRELQVLELLKTELSGPEIAEELVVSLHTVRYHTKNIYGKLGVTSRRAALRRAEELGL